MDLKQTSKRLQLIRRLWKDSAVWKFLGKHYMEKEDAGEMILAACKEMKATEPIPLGSYRGFSDGAIVVSGMTLILP